MAAHVSVLVWASCAFRRLMASSRMRAAVARRTMSPRIARRPFTSTVARYARAVCWAPSGSRVMATYAVSALLVTESTPSILAAISVGGWLSTMCARNENLPEIGPTLAAMADRRPDVRCGHRRQRGAYLRAVL